MTTSTRRCVLRTTACGSLAIAAALVGCSKKEEAAAGRRVPARAPPRPPPPRLRPRRRPLKIAFAYIGPVGDGGWTFAHDNGRKALEKELGSQGADHASSRSVPESADAERVFRDMAAQGNTLIFGTSFGYMEPMLKVAADNKGVHFEHATGYKTADNLRIYDNRTYEGAYMAGVVAGGMTKTNTHRRGRLDPDPRGDPQHRQLHAGRAEREPEDQGQGGVGQRVVQPAQGNRGRAVADRRRRRRAAAEHRLQRRAADGREERQVRVRLGLRHDGTTARRPTWPRRSSTGARTTSRPPRTRSTAPGRRARPGGASRKAPSTWCRSPTRCRRT